MRIEDSSGKEINSFEEWADFYENSRQSHQWQKGRSSYSLAEFMLNHNGGDTIQRRVSDALGYSVELERAILEYELRFDQYGQGSVHDLGVFGHTHSGKSLFVGIVAKVDESFGELTLNSYLAAKARQIVGISTNAPERIEQLLALHFTKPDPTIFEVRYKLLYATAGTLAAKADVHVLYVLVFKTFLYDAAKGIANYRDYIQFMDKVGATNLNVLTKGTVGHKLNLKGNDLFCLHDYWSL